MLFVGGSLGYRKTSKCGKANPDVRLRRGGVLVLQEYEKLARADGSYLKEMAKLGKQELVIIDDLGLEPFDAPSRLTLLEILEERIGRKSTIVVSQIPVDRWHEVIGDPTIADAICDRIVHSAHRIELTGESVRKLHAQRQMNAEKDPQ